MRKQSYISSTPDIMRGALVITGTRVPMERILYMISEGYTIDEIHNHYPLVSKKTFKGALAELALATESHSWDEFIKETCIGILRREVKEDNPYLTEIDGRRNIEFD